MDSVLRGYGLIGITHMHLSTEFQLQARCARVRCAATAELPARDRKIAKVV